MQSSSIAKALIFLLPGLLLFFLPTKGYAFNQPLYTNLGATTVFDGMVPPPGLYLSNYCLFYQADDFKDSNGKSLPGDNEMTIMAFIPQLIWVSPFRLLGGNLGLEMAPTVFDIDLDSSIGLDAESGLGDFWIGAFVSYHLQLSKRVTMDCFYNLDVYIPVGEYNSNKDVNPGANLFTIEPFFCFTFNFPHEFAFSSRIHYAFHTTNDDFGPAGDDMRPGDLFHLNYSFSKGIAEDVRLGVVGYYARQTTDDKLNHRHVKDSREQVLGIGPSIWFRHHGNSLEFKTMYETNVENRPKGINSYVRIIISF